jgi:hypothetical protein
VYVWSGNGVPEGEIVGEVNVSSELVAKAKGMLEAKLGLLALLGEDKTIGGHFSSQLTAG